jgi:hypothetical protein
MGDASQALVAGPSTSLRRRAVIVVVAVAMVVAGLVGPGSAPASGATKVPAYTFGMLWSKGKPVRWDPCKVITWRINYAAGSSFRKELPRMKSAFAEVGRVTGITFRYLGTSSRKPFTRSGYGETASILVGFAKPGTSGLPRRSSAIGLGGASTGMPELGFDVFYSKMPYTQGQAAFLSTAVKRLSASQRRTLYLHELGHVIGLQHTGRRSQVMYPSLSSSTPSHYAKGDRAGLKKLGRSQGCVRVPSRPAAPTVTVSGSNLVISVPAVSSPQPVTYRLESFGYRSSTGTARSWTIPISTFVDGGGFGQESFHVTAVNYFGERSGPDTDWSIEPPPP